MVAAVEDSMQEIAIDFDALDASYIDGMEFCFWASLKNIDPFQPHLTEEERNDIMVTRYGASEGCGADMHLDQVAKRINEYWTADED